MIILRIWRKLNIGIKVVSIVILLLIIFYLTLVVSIWPEHYFWVDRKDASMPVWVRGNIDSGVFIVFNHGGPGSSGTLESIIEVNPGNGQLGHPSPLKVFEDCLLYTSPSPRDRQKSRMPSSA